MAVAVPIIASAMGASTAVSIGIGIATAVTGIGGKINKAASKVFGKDLVNAANLVGGIAMAAGWNPAESWQSLTGGASAGGAAAADASGMAQADGFAGGAAADASRSAASLNPMTSDLSIGATSGGGALSQASNAAGAPGNLIDRGVKWFGDQPDRTKAALIQAGGSVMAGAAGGLQKAEEERKAIAERKRQEQLFKTGSSGAGTRTYAPGGILKLAGGG